ncbi:MAG: hypothetical protein ACXWDN_10975 [Limisphaerales bacterium]
MATQATPEAKQDYNALLQALMPFAEQMLKKNGEFFPFGAVVSTTGEVSAQAAFEGNDTPQSEDVIASLVQAFQTQARGGNIRATGICSDGRILHNGKETDAVIISLEHVSGNATKTCVPYSKGLFGGYSFGQIVGSMAEPKIFVAG